jgi:hypothetical protein
VEKRNPLALAGNPTDSLAIQLVACHYSNSAISTEGWRIPINLSDQRMEVMEF